VLLERTGRGQKLDWAGSMACGGELGTMRTAAARAHGRDELESTAAENRRRGWARVVASSSIFLLLISALLFFLASSIFLSSLFVSPLFVLHLSLFILFFCIFAEAERAVPVRD
jgi:hypothetical protein